MEKYKEYGLTNYQVLTWVHAVMYYGKDIMQKSLLSQAQKELIISLTDLEWQYELSK